MGSYVCPECGMMYAAPGKCGMCNVGLVKAGENGASHSNPKAGKAGAAGSGMKNMERATAGQMQHTGGGHAGHHAHMIEDFRKRFIVSVLLTLPVLALSPLIQSILGFSLQFGGSSYVLFGLSSIIFFYGGIPFFRGFFSEIGKRQPGMMTLIAVAVSVAYFYSAAVVFGLGGKPFFWELATLIDVMLIGHWIEMRSVLGASRALEGLAELMPDTAHLLKKGGAVEVKTSSLKKGERVLIKPGERVPADGTVYRGKSSVNESMLTGESLPTEKKKGEKLIGGSINGEGALEMEVGETGEETYLNKVMVLVRQAQESKSGTQRLADRAAMWLTFIALGAGSATLAYWALYGGDLAFAIERMATVMVIACPHALGLAIPLVSAVSTAICAKNGLLIRNRSAFENSRKVTSVVFDKTGTLTKGKFGVGAVSAFGKFTEKDVLAIAASLERNSEHPLAGAIVNKAEAAGAKLLRVSGFRALKGEGVEGKVRGKKAMLLSLPAALKRKVRVPEGSGAGKTSALLIIGGKPAGVISFEDSIREESYAAIRRLQGSGIKCWMLTGDSEDVAKSVSGELGMDGYFAQVLPHQKQEKIKELQEKGEFVAMAGDGINDAPALAQADVGIAIGSGTDIAAETADIILVDSNPNGVGTLISFGRATYSKMLQNLFWATGYNAIAIPLAAGVLYSSGILVSPAIGAAVMSISTVIVAANAKLLSLKKE
ncbi:copper-translocating P-type ATPase [Candidatus Micrarchaeota archaeon]|nr:copper-translocating P-type ATPase [Candidatus Micrarchaeota archaeon]